MAPFEAPFPDDLLPPALFLGFCIGAFEALALADPKGLLYAQHQTTSDKLLLDNELNTNERALPCTWST